MVRKMVRINEDGNGLSLKMLMTTMTKMMIGKMAIMMMTTMTKMTMENYPQLVEPHSSLADMYDFLLQYIQVKEECLRKNICHQCNMQPTQIRDKINTYPSGLSVFSL